MTGIQKRRRKCSQNNDSASAVDSSAVDSKPASLKNDTASVVDSRPASLENAAASAVDSRPTSLENAAASAVDSRPALQENASASALDSRPASSSFEFSVTSEEGINLYVDMNSSMVDWHKRLENGMCVCRCLEENKFQSFREQLLYLGNNHKQTNNSFGWKSDSGVKDGNTSFASSNSLKEKSDNSLLNQPDAKKGPLGIFAAEACSFHQEESECLEEQKEHPVSISSNLSASISSDLSVERPEKIERMDPNAFHVPHGKIASCSMDSLATDGPQTTLNYKNMKRQGEFSKNIKIKMWRNTQNVIPLPVSSVSAIESKCSEVSCLENEPACSSSVNDPSPNLIDAAQSMETGIEKFAKSIENDHTHLNILSAEDQAGGSPVNGTKALCKSEKVMSDGSHKQKRYKSLFDKVSLQFSGRILRSAVRPRRSPRLVSKAVTP